MLEFIITQIHQLLPTKVKPYRLESNEHSITISFNDLLKNSINIRINLKEVKFRYFIMDKSKDWKAISKSTLKVLLKTLKEKPSFTNLIESIGIENH